LAGALLDLTAIPQTCSWNKGDLLLREGEGCMEKKAGREEEMGRRGEGREEYTRAYHF